MIYTFCSLSNCSDGTLPQTGMILDSSGNLYGTTSFGDSFNRGVLFKLHKGTFVETVLYDFCKKARCTDRANPGPVISDGAGNFFGVTIEGGKYNLGTVYEFTP